MRERAEEISEWRFEARGGEYWGEIFPHPDPERPETWEAWFQEMEMLGGGRVFREARVRLRGQTLEERHFDNEATRRYNVGPPPIPAIPTRTLQVRGGLYSWLLSLLGRCSPVP